MLAIVGSIPVEDYSIVSGTVLLEGDQIIVGDKSIPVNRGTPAMIAAAIKTLEYMNKPNPFCYLVGDIGDGKGCNRLYRHLTSNITTSSVRTLALHYFQPNVDLFKQLLSVINAMPNRPTLIADAGFMYVAKMSGDASSFDLFTPDVGELAYLADEEAPHPFYTRGFILHDENHVPDLIERAYSHNNAASYMIVKGSTDYVVDKHGIIETIDTPIEEALEAMGGTGDTVTGIVSALINSGMDIVSSSVKAAKVNRLAGSFAKPTPATQVYEIIKEIPRALDEIFKNEEED